MQNMWGSPSSLPGPPDGSLRTREDSSAEGVPLTAIVFAVIAMIVVPMIVSLFFE